VKTYEVVFDEKADKGVYALSCVENPAMEDLWLTLADHPQEIQFAAVDNDKRLLLGAALIPNKKVYRNIEGNEFNIVFNEETIEKCAHSFIKNGFQGNSSENHDIKLEDVSVVQSWIVDDPDKDKSNFYGKRYEKGTWVTMMKVDNPKTWQDAKDGKLNGFSIDGLFSLKEMGLKNHNMSEKNIIDSVINGIKGMFKVKMGQATLKDGTTKIEFEGDKPQFNMPIFVMATEKDSEEKRFRAPEGVLELDNGEKLNIDKNGLLMNEEIKEEQKIAPVETAPVEETAKVEEKQDIVAELKAYMDIKLSEMELKFTKEVDAEKAKNLELETKLQAEPSAKKIVRTELSTEVLSTSKGRILQALQNAQN